MLVITLMVLWTMFNVMLLVGTVTWLVREFLVKRPRRQRWVAAHDGMLIGSEEFTKWCAEQGVNPGHYL